MNEDEDCRWATAADELAFGPLGPAKQRSTVISGYKIYPVPVFFHLPPRSGCDVVIDEDMEPLRLA